MREKKKQEELSYSQEWDFQFHAVENSNQLA